MIFTVQTWRRFASKRQEGAGASALFLIGSVVSHGLLYGIAASVSSGGTVTGETEPTWIEIDVAEAKPEVVKAPRNDALPPEDLPLKVAEAKAATPPRSKPRKAAPVQKSAPTALTQQDSAPSETQHIAPSIDDAGLEEAADDSSVIIDPNASESEDVAQVAPAGLGDGNDQTVDPRVVIRAWMKRVQQSVQMRALRDYPRAAQRMRLQGNVFIAMNVDASGRVTNVRAARASGHSALDDAAVEAVLAIGELPTPPLAFLRMGKPLTIPVAYRIR